MVEPVTYNPAAWDVERAALACSRVGWSSQLKRSVGIGSHSLASLHDRMPVGNFTRWGQGLLER